MNWREQHRPAQFETILGDGVVKCGLSPRRCEIKPGKQGFCGVRGNVGGHLVTFNYGKGVHPTEETIETEAVNHYAPGERILSLGNVGCTPACELDFGNYQAFVFTVKLINLKESELQ